MKSLKLIGLALIAVFALGAFAASASAEEGFLVGGSGTPKTGTFLGGSVVFETTSKSTIECTKVDDTTLTFTNDKTYTATLAILECKALGFGIRSEGDPAKTILVPVKFLVCLDPKNSVSKALVDNFGIVAEIAGTLKLEVEGVKVSVELKGQVLSAVLTTGKANLFNVEFAKGATAGSQAVTECLQGENKLGQTLLSSFNKGAFESTNEQITSGLVQFEKATELMDS
jgi:hypothetical protein